jgi:hypothetical protein
VRDLLGLEAAHFAQRERDLGIRGQRRVAAGEDQTQPIVFERLMLEWRRVDRRLELPGEFHNRRVETRTTAQDVDRLEPASGHQPRERVVGQPVAWPPLDGGRERFVQRLFGQIEIADKPDERREDAA